MRLLNLYLIIVLAGFSLSAHSKRSLPHTRIAGENDTYQANVTSDKDLTITDAPNTGGVDKIFNLTTTPQELRIGATAKVNRKYVYMEAVSQNVKWGFNTSCNFSLPRKGFFILPVGQNTVVYLCASVGTAQMVGAEL